jgi:hypothetical protein
MMTDSVAIEQNNVSGFGLLFAQLQTQADPFDLLGGLASLQRVSWPPPTVPMVPVGALGRIIREP